MMKLKTHTHWYTHQQSFKLMYNSPKGIVMIISKAVHMVLDTFKGNKRHQTPLIKTLCWSMCNFFYQWGYVLLSMGWFLLVCIHDFSCEIFWTDLHWNVTNCLLKLVLTQIRSHEILKEIRIRIWIQDFLVIHLFSLTLGNRVHLDFQAYTVSSEMFKGQEHN